jgi:pentatricopeptide repeat protein
MTGAKPDGITFVGVILACTHGGLVDEGKLLFNSMRGEFGRKPRKKIIRNMLGTALLS